MYMYIKIYVFIYIYIYRYRSIYTRVAPKGWGEARPGDRACRARPSVVRHDGSLGEVLN